MDTSKSSGEAGADESSRERGVLHRWRGYSCSVSPERVLLSRPVIQAALGSCHGLLLTEGGFVYSFGELPWKQGAGSHSTEPLQEACLNGRGVVSVASGSFHCGAVTRDGCVLMWGDNSHGQCGLAGRSQVPSPTPITLLDTEGTTPRLVRAKSVACGAQHTLALSVGHEVWAWGSGCQLGLVSQGNAPVCRPQKVEDLAGRYVVQVACGGFHSLALVRSLPPSSARTLSLDKCGRCQQLLYTMVDRDDHVIISDNHYCPLGVEINEVKGQESTPEKQQQAQQEQPGQSSEGQGSNEVTQDVNHVGSSLSSEAFCPAVGSAGDSPEAGSKAGNVVEPDEGSTPAQTDTAKAPVKRTRSSQFPDEQELKNYLKRMSDLSLSEQTGTAAHSAPSSPVSDQPNTTPMPSPGLAPASAHLPPASHGTQLHQSGSPPAVTGESSTPATPMCVPHPGVTQPVVPLHSPACLPTCPHTHLNPAFDEHLASTCDDTFDEDSGLERDLDPPNGPGGGGGEVGVPGLCEGPRDPLSGLLRVEVRGPSTRSASLMDVRLEEISSSSSKAGRRNSLPGLSCQGSPLMSKWGHRRVGSAGGKKMPVPVETEPLLPSLYTEVWSWGRGQEGQLGHGDRLPRLQPLCIKTLSKREVVKVEAGAHHSLALTAQCQVFSWGSNKAGQLGHLNSLSTAPQPVKMSEGIRVWDVGAGQTHTLLLADGDCVQPILYYSGEQVAEDGPTGTYTQTPALLPFCMNMGYLSNVFGGGQTCLALSDQNIMGFISTLHELCAAERKFYCHLSAIRSQILRPLLARESVKACLCKSFMLLQTLAGSFSRLCHLIGQHSVSLTRFLQRERDVRSLAMLKQTGIFLDTYKEYSSSVGNFLVMGGFLSLLKPLQECFGKKLEVLQQLSEPKDKGSSPVSSPVSSSGSGPGLLQSLLYLPVKHMHQYSRLLLKLATCFHVESEEYSLLDERCSRFEAIALQLLKHRKEAEKTLDFWRSLPTKASDALRTPSRRLVCESNNKALTLQNTGRFSVNRFILFNDALVYTQFSSYHIYPLATLWIEPLCEEDDGLFGLKFTTPEDSFTALASSPAEKASWLRSINQAVEKLLEAEMDAKVTGSSLGLGSSGGQRAEPRMSRTATHTFAKEGRYKDATYEGRWLCGKPHGRGTIRWPDGRVYIGMFKHGQEDGFGDFVIPIKNSHKTDHYQGHCKEGKMHGFGTYWYASGEVYEGSFWEGQRHGHGMLSSGKMASSNSSVFVGHWVHDRKAGYGVFDDITRGEKYMGLWMDDQKQGHGVVVTQYGLYYEGQFSSNKMMGLGLLLADDDTTYEGDFSEDWTLNGKGVLSLPNGDKMEGVFVGQWSSGLKIAGTYQKPNPYGPDRDRERIRPYKLGGMAVPADQKWAAVFEECWRRLGCDSPGRGHTGRAWDSIAISLTQRQHRDSPELLTRSQHMTLECLEVIPQLNGQFTAETYNNVRRYLIKACDTPLHPLGWLLETLVTVYRMTYVGVGSNRRLLQQAVLEIQSYIVRIYQLVRFLFPSLPDDGTFIPEVSAAESLCSSTDSGLHSEIPEQGFVVSCCSLLLPVLLPRLYPPLFTLYSLEREREDELYWDCVSRLNKQPDRALMGFLGVHQKFWPVAAISVLGDPEKVLTSTKDACYATAVETLQQISTTFTPADKLLVIRHTFEEMTQEALTLLDEDFRWSMDDLFPLYLYVVLRARIRNLGSEVSLIEDLMDPHLQHGEDGLMFTTLKACYIQIQREKTT
ncbi:alsin-like isoform X2 [Alosa sapidissima]|uniref:alsin-like isoform X2 n=1 Tax=Alosa sapidissima TaxID=34773 RepID=UPI001C09DAC5|nr:alsin-like isoform X2 [Alosa sapidissima]